MDYISSSKLYGSIFFQCQSVNKKLPAHVILAINRSGVVVVNVESKDILVTYEMIHIKSWGFGTLSFILVIGNGEKIFFKTTEGVQMHRYMLAYAENSTL